MSISTLTLISLGGILAAALAHYLGSTGTLPRYSRLARILNLGLTAMAGATLLAAIYMGAALATICAVIWLISIGRTYPGWAARVTVGTHDGLSPLSVSSAAANSWSSVAGQGGHLGFGSMARLSA